MNSRELITSYPAYFREKPPVHVILPDLKDTRQLQTALLQGEQSSDVLSSAVRYKVFSQEHIWATGLSMLSTGTYTRDEGKHQHMTPKEAGKVLRSMLSVGGVSASTNKTTFNYDDQLLEIKRADINLPYQVEQEAIREIDKLRVQEFQKHIFTSLADGYINLFPPYNGYNPSVQEKQTGKAILTALEPVPSFLNTFAGWETILLPGPIPAFRQDFDKWCRKTLSIDTVRNQTPPHIFRNILNKLGLKQDSGWDAYHAINDAYTSQSQEKLRIIHDAFEHSLTNTGTGDRYVGFDEVALPLVYNLVGKNPGWVELTMSKGVFMLGTLDRMKTMGMRPNWMIADIYHPEEVWETSIVYTSVSNPRNPWEIIPFAQSDPEEVHERVKIELTDQRQYLGFVRGDFERRDFSGKILSYW